MTDKMFRDEIFRRLDGIRTAQERDAMTDDDLVSRLVPTLKRFAEGAAADERERIALRLAHEADKLDGKRPEPGETTSHHAMADGIRMAIEIVRNPDLTVG